MARRASWASLIGGIGDLIKLPAILTDVALGYVVYTMARELGVTGRRATIAAAVVIFNPITWFDSVIWGQVDSFGTVFLLLAIRELWRGRSERVGDPGRGRGADQAAAGDPGPDRRASWSIRRALWPAGGWGDEDAPAPAGIRLGAP